MIDNAVLIVTIGSFLAAFVNAAFATGGVYIMLFTSISVLPVAAAIPLQSAFSAASLLARVYLFWHHIDRRIVRTFVFGSVFGVVLGARTFVAMPESVILILLGLVLLLLIWLPSFNRPLQLKHPFAFVGLVHGYLGTVFGVGGILQPLILKTKLLKMQITGTLAACMLALDGMKAISYGGIGFDYTDYWPHIIGATLAGFAGTWVGKRVTHRISEDMFRKVFRILVTLVAIRMIYKGLAGG